MWYSVTKEGPSSHNLHVFHTSPSYLDTSLTPGMRILFDPGNTVSWSQLSDREELSTTSEW